MSRADLAIVLVLLCVAAAGWVAVTTVRYNRYRRELMRGRRHLKPVRRPFWMN